MNTSEANTSHPVEDGLPLPKRYWAIGGIGLAIAMSVIDSTITNVALPLIGHDLDISSSTIIWVVNAYQLALTIALLPLAALGDKIGYRKIFNYGLLLFIFTSTACFLSDSFWTLIIARTFQGFGAAAIASVSSALLKIVYPRNQLARGMGLNALFVAVSIAAGPTIGGSILAIASWHWIFAINVPLGIAALIVGWLFLPDNPIKNTKMKLDKESIIFNAFTFGLLIFALDGIAHKEEWWIIGTCILGFVGIGYAFLRRELKEENPLFPVDLMKIPAFSTAVIASITAYSASMITAVDLPFYFQDSLKMSAFETGLLMSPWPLATMITAPIAGRLVSHTNMHLVSVVGLGIFTAGLLLMAFLPANPSYWSIIWRLAVCGAGFGFFKTPNNSLMIGSAPAQRSGAASGMLATARLIGQTLGAALVPMIFTMIPIHSMRASLLLGTLFGIVATIVSGSQIKSKKTKRETSN